MYLGTLLYCRVTDGVCVYNTLSNYSFYSEISERSDPINPARPERAGECNSRHSASERRVFTRVDTLEHKDTI